MIEATVGPRKPNLDPLISAAGEESDQVTCAKSFAKTGPGRVASESQSDLNTYQFWQTLLKLTVDNAPLLTVSHRLLQGA